jgi:phosphatidylserine/phosphatidylglycerophosphate/cardiolipin synthase-like enzyme
MKIVTLLKALPFLLLACSGAAEEPVTRFLQPHKAIPLPSGVEVHFGPSHDLEAEIVRLIEEAETEIVFNAYAITSHRILKALVDSYVNRKIFTVGLLDPKPSVSRYTTPHYFTLNGLPFAYPRLNTGFNNNNYIVIDRRVVVTGSYQFTQMRRDSSENLMVIYEPSVAVAYYNHFVENIENSYMTQPNTTEDE